MLTNINRQSGILSLTLLLIFLFPTQEINAQRGYSTAALAMGKMRGNFLQIPLPAEIIIEEYMNYHTHLIATPRSGQHVNMEMRWGNHEISTVDNEAVLQIGLATDRLKDLSNVPPVNVSLVIDKSGSMSGDRIAKAKQAALEFVKRLRDQDKISIVAFDNGVQVMLPATSAGNRQQVNQAIQNIQVGGSTNLNLGMITGYQEVVKNYQPNYSNKVIMLTDAITNTGVTDPTHIIQNSKGFNPANEIDITLIGVGVDFNNGLSRQLTASTRNSIHFINDNEDIKKVFIEEVESLLHPVGRKVQLEITYDDRNLELTNLYGYQPTNRGNTITIDLDKMNSGLTQVVLTRFRLKNAQASNRIPVSAKLTYFDIRHQKTVTLNESIHLEFDKKTTKRIDKLADSEVKKNYTIAFMAQSLKDMALLHNQNQSIQGQQLINNAIQSVKSQYPNLTDSDIQRVLDILEKYATQMEQLITHNTSY